MAQSWRKLENFIIEYIKAGGYLVEEQRATGDRFMIVDEPSELNITEFAKELTTYLDPPLVIKSTPLRRRK